MSAIFPRPKGQQPRGYSLVEVVIAGFILVTAIAGAAMLAHNLLVTEENNLHVSYAINTQEQAAKLYALGLEQATITNIMPDAFTNSTNVQPGNVYFAYSSNAITNVELGTLERVTNTMHFFAAKDMGNANNRRSNTVVIVRPSIR